MFECNNIFEKKILFKLVHTILNLKQRNHQKHNYENITNSTWDKGKILKLTSVSPSHDCLSTLSFRFFYNLMWLLIRRNLFAIMWGRALESGSCFVTLRLCVWDVETAYCTMYRVRLRTSDREVMWSLSRLCANTWA